MRARRALAAATTVVALCALALVTVTARAAPPPPAELEVAGGDGWRSIDSFDLSWRNPPVAPGAEPIADVHYLVRDPVGAVVIAERQLGWAAQRLAGLRVPGGPGAYTVEVWLEDAAGATGAPATARLRYDFARPAAVEPFEVPGWVGRAELPLVVRVTHPPGPLPLAGIRGYAVSVDRYPESSPCAGSDRCADGETDLRGGADDDTLRVDGLPEGLSYLHAVAVSGSGMRSASVGHSIVRVDTTDPVTRLSGAPAGWVSHPVRLTATATDAASGMAAGGPGGPLTAIRVDDGAPATASGGTAETTVIESGAHTVAYYARDAAGNIDDGSLSNGQRNPSPSTAVLRIDREPPLVAFQAAEDPADPESIVARVSDRLSGPDPGRGEISVRAAGSGDLFDPLPTTAIAGELETRWDSDAHPDGDYELRAIGYDRAGNLAASGRRAGGSIMVIHSPLKAPVTLSAVIDAGGSGRPARVPYGRTVSLSGRLLAVPGTPLVGAPIHVVEHFAPGPGPAERVSEVSTDGGGRFRLRLAPGASREVVAQYSGSRAFTRAVSEPDRLDVRAGASLSASSSLAVVGGRPIEFRGAVAGPSFPPGGATVQLQYRLPGGSRWTELRTLKTNRRGRFRYRYSFSDDDSRGVRFLFRAFVPTQSDWPYEPGGSGPVAVRGI